MNIQDLKISLNNKHLCSNGSFSSSVDFNVWADAAYLILLQRLNIDNEVYSSVKYIISCLNENGYWGIISNKYSEASYKNTLIAYKATKKYLSKKEILKIEQFLKDYNGNRWVDPYTEMLIAEENQKIYYPPIFLNFLPSSFCRGLGNLHLSFPTLFKWSIFLYPSGWSRNAFPQLTCCGHLLSGKPKRKVNKLIHKILVNQLDNGSWFDTILPTIGSIYALYLFGYERSSSFIIKGLEFLQLKLRNNGGLDRFNLSVWNTSLSLIALLSQKDIKANFSNSVSFLIDNQSKNGGWAFSEFNPELPDHDDTALSLTALRFCLEKEYYIPEETIENGINFLLKRQNKDGGWAAFDKNQSHKKAGYLPPWHVEYGHELKDPSTADVTSHALYALTLYKDDFQLEQAIQNAISFLEKDQMPQGYWYGRWGLCYIYGTSRAIIGLCAAGCKKDFVRKGAIWLESFQNSDGGWGENYLSYFQSSPIQDKSTLEQTSWAIIALIRFYKKKTASITKGIEYLKMVYEKYGFSSPPTSYSAAAIEPAIYDIYNKIFPLQAFNEYNNLN